MIAAILCLLGMMFGGGAGAEEIAEEVAVEVVEEMNAGTGGEVSVEFARGMDEEALAGGYINSVMPARWRLRVSRPSGLSNLTGANRMLYIAMRTRISEVADGEKSSTVFTIPASEIFNPRMFTAEELGVEEPMFDEDGKPSAEGLQAIKDKIAEEKEKIDFVAVMNCLMADCPYELYWFGKTYLKPTENFQAGKAKSTTTGEYKWLTIMGDYTVTLHVSKDYAVSEPGEDGERVYSRTEVDTSFGESVQAAARNADEILEMYSGASDYEKLYGYKTEICALAEYNYAAVNEKWEYGDAWQIVWVFDGKPSTKVVCEGYSKAFQYLCDLGTANVTAITVQGQIPAGEHMWNIVTIGKRNYLADLTNCDIGLDLFLKGYSDGDVKSGYYVKHGSGTIKYTYNTALNSRTEKELTLNPWDYSKVREAGEAALPDGIEEIEDEAFAGAMIRSVRVPAGCRRIGARAFAGSMLEEVYLASGETEIAEDAFEGIEEYVTVHWGE